MPRFGGAFSFDIIFDIIRGEQYGRYERKHFRIAIKNPQNQLVIAVLRVVFRPYPTGFEPAAFGVGEKRADGRIVRYYLTIRRV